MAIGELLDVVVRVAQDSFIVAFLGWMLFSDCRPSNPVRRHLVDKTRRAFTWLGLNAQWRMFSPNPPMRTIWPRARLTLADASVIVWEPEPLGTMSVRRKIAQKKFHKYYHEVARPGVPPRTHRDFVEYLLRSVPVDAACTTIELYRVARVTPPPGQPAHADLASQTLLYTFHPHPRDHDG